MSWQDGKTNIKNWRTIGKDALNLMHREGETLLKETLETANRITSRAEKLLSFCIPTAWFLVTYAFNSYVNRQLGDFLPITAIACLIVLTISVYFSYQAVKPYAIHVTGTLPSVTVTEEFVGERQENEQHTLLVLAICEQLQSKIETNEEINKRRTGFVIEAINTLLVLPITPVISYLIYLLYHLPNCVFAL